MSDRADRDLARRPRRIAALRELWLELHRSARPGRAAARDLLDDDASWDGALGLVSPWLADPESFLALARDGDQRRRVTRSSGDGERRRAPRRAGRSPESIADARDAGRHRARPRRRPRHRRSTRSTPSSTALGDRGADRRADPASSRPGARRAPRVRAPLAAADRDAVEAPRCRPRRPRGGPRRGPGCSAWRACSRYSAGLVAGQDAARPAPRTA